MNSPAPQRRYRCAVYTRKSTDEGLELEYTSIDAQRDAGQAYITSRRAEGWIPVGEDYDDGGFSGGSLTRPALQRLLDAIRAGKVDTVVAYKIDRLSRSLFDFAELVKVFDQYGVTFVSVTQQFNTTDAMGRMLLNILLTFAQFERELTAERIRDKMVASKKKGLWMHGIPPLGYDIRERRLAILTEEADQVRMIFRRFVERGSLMGVVEELRAKGLCNKTWTTKEGRVRQGQLHDKSSVHKILHNRTYLGELKHRDQQFQGTHPPIITPELWSQVHAVLDAPARARAGDARAKVDFLLKGLVVGPDGRVLTPWHTTKKNGRRYRYYVSTTLFHEGREASPLPRLPASELEAAVVDQLRRIFKAPTMVKEVAAKAIALDPALDAAKVTLAMRQVDRVWNELFPAEQRRIVQLLVEKVIVSPDQLEVRFHPLGMGELASEFAGTKRSKAA